VVLVFLLWLINAETGTTIRISSRPEFFIIGTGLSQSNYDELTFLPGDSLVPMLNGGCVQLGAGCLLSHRLCTSDLKTKFCSPENKLVVLSTPDLEIQVCSAEHKLVVL